jgi:hypothetical protein
LKGFWVVELYFQVKERLGQYKLQTSLLDETLNMKPNGNEKKVLILEIHFSIFAPSFV